MGFICDMELNDIKRRRVGDPLAGTAARFPPSDKRATRRSGGIQYPRDSAGIRKSLTSTVVPLSAGIIT